MSLEEACEKLKLLDFRTDPAAQDVFCRVAAEYACDELKNTGIDLYGVASSEDVRSFCKLWLSQPSTTDNDLALIGVVYAIQLNVKEILAQKRGA